MARSLWLSILVLAAAASGSRVRKNGVSSYFSRKYELTPFFLVDIVTERHANLHNELIHLLEQPPRFAIGDDARLYVVAYRPGRTAVGDRIEIWPTPLALGRPLPTVPLALRDVATLPLDLETTYDTTCQDCLL